jgi:hypothetical protein
MPNVDVYAGADGDPGDVAVHGAAARTVRAVIGAVISTSSAARDGYAFRRRVVKSTCSVTAWAI